MHATSLHTWCNHSHIHTSARMCCKRKCQSTIACAHSPYLQKFWVLETVARIPYFAYISILHLYESFGFWRAGAELRKIHFAEEWNELHHREWSWWI